MTFQKAEKLQLLAVDTLLEGGTNSQPARAATQTQVQSPALSPVVTLRSVLAGVSHTSVSQL